MNQTNELRNYFEHPASLTTVFSQTQDHTTVSSCKYQGIRGNLFCDSSTSRINSVCLLPHEEHHRSIVSFQDSLLEEIAKVKQLSSFPWDEPLQLTLQYMLYAKVVTCLEVYLYNVFKYLVRKDGKFFRLFVETFHRFKGTKFKLSEFFRLFDSIEKYAFDEIEKVSFHNLAHVKDLYRNVLGIEFPNDMVPLYKAVDIRHDILHRNGKNKNGDLQNISKADVEDIVNQVVNFVSLINESLLSLVTKLD
jgi:hypothetical protein